MKKIIFMLLAGGLAFIACDTKSDKKAGDKIEVKQDSVSGTAEQDVAETPTSETAGVPKFSSPEVQKFADDYTVFVDEYVIAVKSGDPAKLQALAAKSQEWTKKITDFSTKLTPEDAQKWADYSQELAKKMMVTVQ